MKLWVGTRKGLVLLERTGAGWIVRSMAHQGVPVPYAFQDARSGKVFASLDHGHWGAKLSRSEGIGAEWVSVDPPVFPEGEVQYDAFSPGETKPAKLDYLWYMTPGGLDQPGRIWFGTNPGGLFLSDDDGDHIELVRGLWDHPTRSQWTGGGRDTPGIHSIVVDPRDSAHLHIGISCGGVYETRDGGVEWAPRNKGLTADFLPNPEAEVGQDPHFIMACEAHPDVLWQQNHCGIWRSGDGAAEWKEIHQEEGPAKFGFPIAAHADNPDVAWVVPAISDGIRMADGAVVVCRTEDGGRSWATLRQGLPQENAWDLVYRHALDIDGERLAFGSTTGNLWFSDDGGEHWEVVSHHLPPIYSVRFAP